MRKILKKMTAVVLAVAMAAAFSPAVVKVSGAKTASLKVSIKVTNKDDLIDMEVGDNEKIKYKVTVSGGEKEERKKAKELEFSTKDKKIATVNSKGVVKAKASGKTKIELVSKLKKNGKALAKTSVVVEVSQDLDMVFKHSNLYFIVPEGTAFPVEIDQGGKDARGCPFDIKTKGFNGKLSDFKYASDNPKIADVNSEQGKLVLSGYGETDIECTYKKDDSVGDSFTCYVLTQAQYDQMKAEDSLDDVDENTFSDGSDNEDDGPEEPEDTDTAEDVDNED